MNDEYDDYGLESTFCQQFVENETLELTCIDRRILCRENPKKPKEN